MTEMTHTIPPRLREIIEDFQWSEGREKLELLLDFSERMPPLPDWLVAERDQMEQIHECMTPVLVRAVIQDGRMSFYFDIPAESPTVRGYAAILAEGLQDATPQEILRVPGDFFQEMGLDKVLSSQRLNGISAILAHVKRLALEAMNQTNQ